MSSHFQICERKLSVTLDQFNLSSHFQRLYGLSNSDDAHFPALLTCYSTFTGRGQLFSYMFRNYAVGYHGVAEWVNGPVSEAIKHSGGFTGLSICLLLSLPFTLRQFKPPPHPPLDEPVFSLFPTYNTPHRLELMRVLTQPYTHSLSSDPFGNKEAKGKSAHLVSYCLALWFPDLPLFSTGRVGRGV